MEVYILRTLQIVRNIKKNLTYRGWAQNEAKNEDDTKIFNTSRDKFTKNRCAIVRFHHKKFGIEGRPTSQGESFFHYENCTAQSHSSDENLLRWCLKL